MLYDLLITDVVLLPLAPVSEIIEHGYVAVKDGKIAALGPVTDLKERPEAATVIDGRSKLVMPGLVNCHTHAPMTLFRGLADDLPLMAWLQDHIFPAEARSVNPDMVYWCSKLAAAEMILSGTTTVADGYFLEDHVAEAFIEAGLRSVAAQGVIDFPAPGVPDPGQNVMAAEQFITRWQGKNPLLSPAVFCHSPYTCSPETLKKAKEMVRRYKVKFFLHLAETKTEVEQLQKQHGASPVQFLEKLNLLDENTVCIHGVWLSGEDLQLLARTGAKVVTCPQSNMKLGAGIAPLPEMLDAGVAVGLGTDGCASNNRLDMFYEMDVCAKLHKVKDLDPTALPAPVVMQLATAGGAAVLGLENQLGGLEPGKAADLILVDLTQPHLQPFYTPDLLVYGASGADVATVIINGRVVMQDKRILTFDADEAMRKVSVMAENLL